MLFNFGAQRVDGIDSFIRSTRGMSVNRT
jgi:hypothetical protein